MAIPVIFSEVLFASAAYGAAVTGVTFDTGSFEIDNFDGTILSGGNPTIDHDGTVLQLGYYSVPTNASTPWIPLTGEGSANTAFANSTIGDRAELGGDNGIFIDGWLFTTGSLTTGQSFPPAGALLRVRFYNSSSLAGATAFQEVYNPVWLWQSPAEATPPNLYPVVRMSLDDAGTRQIGGDLLPANHHIKTDQGRLVPEPTALALLVAATLGLSGIRRR